MSKFTDELIKELMLSPMKSSFTLSRDQLIEVMFSTDVHRRDGLYGAAVKIHKREEAEKKNPGIAPG
jgi:hypothetical protein